MGQKAMAVAGVCSCNGHENSKEDSLEYYGRYLGGRRSKLLQRLPPFKLEKFLLFNLFYLFSPSAVLPLLPLPTHGKIFICYFLTYHPF